MNDLYLIAPHAAGKVEADDPIFAVARKAKEAAAKFGKEKVVDASIGAIYNDEGGFISLTSVNNYYRQMAAEDLMNYAPIAGLPEFQKAAIDFVFQGYQPEGTIAKAVATPGGTGGVRNVFSNYLEEGETVLVPDWFWGPYRTIALENQRRIDTYSMFDSDNRFTVEDLKKKTLELLKDQDRIVAVFNTPAHNPTGYSMTLEDWREVIDFFSECAADKRKKFVLLIDIAYLDYAGPAESTRKFLQLFGGLPLNLLVAIAFSMSKSFLIYGMRCGALIGLTSSPEAAEEFYLVNSYASRGNWSNCPRGPQRLLADVMQNPVLKAEIDRERADYTQLIANRATIFMKEAREVGLSTLPYYAGFFITVPANNPAAVTEKLAEKNVFAVPLKKGIRFAICSIPTHQVPGLAALTKQSLGNIGDGS